MDHFRIIRDGICVENDEYQLCFFAEYKFYMKTKSSVTVIYLSLSERFEIVNKLYMCRLYEPEAFG